MSFIGRYDAMSPFYDRLWNVTVARSKDHSGIEKLFKDEKHPDFQERFRFEQYQYTRSMFSLGHLPSPSFQLFEPTYDKFVRSKYFLFYRIRPIKFWTPNSTEFRRAALQPDVIQALPESSIGNDLAKEDWLRDFSSSKFCLVMRGDDPQSHALLRAVKVGCIPVVVSDAFPEYAPTLRSSVNMKDYAIFIPEKDFMKDPKKELSKLTEIKEVEIRERLLSLSWAQRVLIPDHPESLFVPAFLHEAELAKMNGRKEVSLASYLRNTSFYMELGKEKEEKAFRKWKSKLEQKADHKNIKK